MMSGYGIQIRMAEANPRAVDPRDVIFKHRMRRFGRRPEPGRPPPPDHLA
jgi:hypothetical protein